MTWELGDTERFVKEAIDDGTVDAVVAAGGDGTVNEVHAAGRSAYEAWLGLHFRLAY